MSTQNLYEERFKKFIDRYFSGTDVPKILGYSITSDISNIEEETTEEITIGAELMKERLRNIFKGTLKKYNFSHEDHPSFEEVANDVLNEFLESTIRDFELYEPGEQEKLKMVFHDLSAQMLSDALEEIRETKRKQDAGIEGKVLPFKGPEGTARGKK